MFGRNRYFHTMLSAALLVFSMFGCGGGGSSDSQRGTLRVSLTDAPASGFDAVNVTVSRVRVHQSAAASEDDSGWSDINLNPPRKINLLNLTNGALDSLGETSLPAGHYTQLRLVLSANTGTVVNNSVVLSGTTEEIPLVTPSAAQSGIKLINEFDVAAGQHVDLLLDFDALKSVVQRGNGVYALKPVIKVIPFTLNGIDGYIDSSITGSTVAVTAQVNGVVVRSTTPDAQSGEFFLARLDPGSYDVVITANGHTTAIIAGVPISGSTSTATVSTITAPITLPTSTSRAISGTVTLNPSSSTAIAEVSAKQSFGNGLTITVKSQAVEGAYVMALPIDAPILGSYGAGTLPISLSTQETTTASAKYAVEASASGYQTQSFNVDLATTDSTQDFLLTP